MAANTFYYYVYEKNLQGDIVAVYSTNGVKLVTYTYDAWGNVTKENNQILTGTYAGAGHNPFLYRGYYYDNETKLYYLNSRYYDPSTGRFLNADGYLNANGDLIGFNMFAYCSNNPVMYTDPTGEFVLTTFLICMGVGAVVGGILGGVTAASNGQDVLTGVITGAVLGGAVGAVIGVGGAALTGAISSTLSKVTTDLISVSMYGGSFGTWEDYALAFAFGGLTGSLGSAISAGNSLAKTAKFLLDVATRPAVNQLAKMGTRGGNFNASKYSYDVVTRSVTFGGTDMVMRGSIGDMNLSIDLGKCFFRAGFRGVYSLP